MRITEIAKKIVVKNVVKLTINASENHLLRTLMAKKVVIKKLTKLILNGSENFIMDASKNSRSPLKDGTAKRLKKSIEVNEKDYHLIKGILNDLSKNVKKKLFGNLLVNSIAGNGDLKNQKGTESGANTFCLLSIVIDVTNRCNLKCPGCWAGNCSEQEDISIELLDRILEEAKELGVYIIAIAGGEPFIREDLMDFFARHDDMLFIVYTNGTCITEEVAKRINEIGNVAPMISVEGFKEDTNKRRGRGIYNRISKTMEWLKNYGVLFGFSAMATKENSEILGSDEFIDHYIEKGCKFGWIFQYIPIGRCPDVSVMATPVQRIKLRKDVERLRETKPIFIVDFWNDGHYIGGCLAGGKHYLHITNNGNVEPCVFAHFYVDNIKNKSLKEVLQSGFFAGIREAQAFSANKNLLSPCMIIDHPRILRDIVKKFKAKASHDDDMRLINDMKIVRHLDKYSNHVNQLTGLEWDKEYSKWKDYWISYFHSETNNTVEKRCQAKRCQAKKYPWPSEAKV